jgi:hypothetical protein
MAGLATYRKAPAPACTAVLSVFPNATAPLVPLRKSIATFRIGNQYSYLTRFINNYFAGICFTSTGLAGLSTPTPI